MYTPFFSVIIPTYNQSNFLKKALDSVFNQTFKNFEIIVIDNHSNDGTSDILKRYKKKIIYKKIKNRGILAKSRNYGIKIAKGKWIAFLDSDDYWGHNKLNIIKKLIQNSSFDVVCHSEWILYSEKKKLNLWSYGPYKRNFYKILLKHGNKFSTSASVVRKSFLDKNNILFDKKKESVSSEDYSFFMKTAQNNANFLFIKRPLGYHLFHKKSVSSNMSKHFKSQESVIRHHIFNIQKFTKDKKKLWLEAKIFLDLRIIFFNLQSKKKAKFKNLFNFFMNKPLYFIWYIKNLLIKKLKDFLIYLFYKSEF
jgi:glycosyltransferase involved in cell wall biosynthesis